MATLLKQVSLAQKDITFQVAVDSETEERLKNDEEYRNQFANQVFQSGLVQGNLDDTVSLPQISTSEGKTGDQNDTVLPKKEDDNEEKFIWTYRSTVLLLETRLEMEEEFNNPEYRKSKLWQNVSDILSSNGYIVSRRQCDLKWRNLLQTYRKIKNKHTSGQGKVSWQFYHIIDREENYRNECENQEMEGYSEKLDDDQLEAIESVSSYQEIGGGEKFTWTYQSTILMIETRLEMEEDFNNNKYRISKLWQMIAETMGAHNYCVPRQQCEVKWRNILQTYRKIKSKLHSGKVKISWPFYNLLDGALGEKPISQLPKKKLPESVSSQTQSTAIKRPISTAESSNDSYYPEPPKRTKLFKYKVDGPPEWFMTLIRKLDTRDLITEEMEKRKARLEADKWNKLFSKLEETKKVEIEKVRAIKRLTEAVGKCLEGL